jgi:hypothetical protein
LVYDDPDIVRDQFSDPGNRIGTATPAFNVSATIPGLSYPEGGDPSDEDFEAAERKGEFEIVNLVKTLPACVNQVTIHKCSVRPAIVEYSVRFWNGTMSLAPSWRMEDVVLLNPEPQQPGYIEM